MPKTISFHNGSNWSRGHNVRDKRFVKEQTHINKSLSDNNIILVDEVVRKAYDRIFGEAVAEYNAKQKRSDRRIDNYYNKIKQDKKKHTVYECIVQIGDKDDTGNNAILEKEALKRFSESWEHRNPNLKLIGSYIHGDEFYGTVHMHIDYIPVALCSRGMKLQNSLDRALEQQGFHTRNIKQTAQIAWQERERKALVDICRDLQIDVYQEPQGITKGREHYSKVEYQREKDRAKKQIEQELLPYQSLVDGFLQADSEKQIEGTPVPTAAKMLIGKENKDKLLYYPSDIEDIQQLAKATAVISAKNEQDKEDLINRYSDLSDKENKAEKTLAYANRQRQQAEQTKKEADEYATQMQKFYSDNSPYIQQLQEKITHLQDNIKWLSQERNYQKDYIKEQSQQIDGLKNKIGSLQSVKQQNNELSEHIKVLEEELKQKQQQLTEKKEKISQMQQICDYNWGMYYAAIDIADVMGVEIEDDTVKAVAERFSIEPNSKYPEYDYRGTKHSQEDLQRFLSGSDKSKGIGR